MLAVLLACTAAVGMTPMNIMAEEGDNSSPVMKEIYVSPSGSADASGTKEDPLNSMDAARQKVNEMNDDMTGDIIVYFEDGEYFVNEKTEFTPEDSGSNGYVVRYKAAPGAEPVFTSGLEVTGWTDAGDPERPGLMVADAPIENTRQMFVDGKMAVRARGNITASIERYGDRTVYTTYNGDHDAYSGYKVGSLEMLDWKHPEDLEFIYDISWAHRIVPVDSVEQLNDSEIFIKMEPESFRTSQIAGGVQANLPSYIENSYELLDEPGEWYFDQSEKKIYYMPEDGQNMDETEVIVPTAEQFFTVEGSADNKVKDISFAGLNFEYNTWLYPSTNGWPEQQANFAHDPKETFNMHAYSLVPQGAIEIKMSEGIGIRGCNFSRLGSAAINILQGAVNTVVEECVFKDISAGGVLVGGVNITDAHPFTGEGMTIENHTHDERYIVKDNTVANNYFNGIGTEYKGSIAITAGYTDHTVITHNTIRNVAYSGISVGWGWGYWDQGGRYGDDETPAEYPVIPVGDAAVSRNNVIEYNDVSQCMMKLHDGAGIYTLGDMPNTSIRYNLVHDNVGWPGGLYFDQGSGGMTVEDNITYNTQMTYFHNIRDNTWGYKSDPPVILDNYFNISPDMEEYPTDLAAQAGVQDSSIIPKELNDMTAPEFPQTGDRILLEGNFGSETGKVVLEGTDGPVVVDEASGNIISWAESQILFRLPGNVVSGRIYVECADGTVTNKSDTLTIGSFSEVLFEEDFDSYEAGEMKGQEQAEQNWDDISDRASIEEQDGSNILKLTSNWGDTIISKEADWTDVLVTLDFYFDVKPTDFGGIYVAARFQDSQNKNIAEFLPSYGQGILFQQYAGGSLSVPGNASYQYKEDTWYSAKIAMIGNEMKVKVWEKDTAEPSLWTGSATFSGIKDGGLSLYYMDFKESFAGFDNIKVMKYEEGATVDLSDDRDAPSAAAVVTGNKNDEGNYSSNVTVSLEAEDSGSGVAEIEYSINGSGYKDYTEQLTFTENGDYTISYRTADRAGNAKAAQTLSFTVAMDDAAATVLEDDFDSYEEGQFTDLSQGYTLTHPEVFEITDEGDGNQILKINGVQNQAVRLLKSETWENTQMTFDFKYANPVANYSGVYVSNYYQSISPDNMYHYPIIPAWGGVFLQTAVNGSANNVAQITNDEFQVQNGVWYSVKVQTSSDHMALKIWERGTEEPSEWMAESNVSGLTGGGGLELSFTDLEGGNSAVFDNLAVKSFEAGGNDEANVTFYTEPADTDVAVQNAEASEETVREDGTYLLGKGTYTYAAEKEGYQGISGELNVQGESDKDVYISLTELFKEADRTELDKIIAEAMAIQNLEIYTDESAAVFNTALENAVKLPDTATQEEVDNAVKALREAIDNLVLKDEDPGTEEPGTGDPGTENPGTDEPDAGGPGNGSPGTGDGGNNGQHSGADAGQTVRTGDSSAVFIWIFAASAAAAVTLGAALVIKRKIRK